MSTITILDTGVVGSAVAIPLIDAGHRIRLQGTYLDSHLVAVVRSGDPHPHTGVVMPPEVTSYLSSDIDVTMAGADVAVLAVSSPGVMGITCLAAPFLTDVHAVWFTSRGFAPGRLGHIQLLPQVMEEVLAQEEAHIPPIVVVGGPCEANEVISRHPIAPVFAAAETPERWVRMVTTRQRRVIHTTDRDGVKPCVALKNVYAIALGIVGGMSKLGNQPFHDLKAVVFARALAELRLLPDAEGVDSWITLGPAGTGDLEVTGLSGRSKVYKMRVGGGERADEALAEIAAVEQTVEGVPAVEFAPQFVQQCHPRLIGDPPLLVAVHTVVHRGRTAGNIRKAVLSL